MTNPAKNYNLSQWQATLELTFSHSARGTQLKRCRHKGPLYVQKPFYPEGRDLAHCYLLHPPGGVVSGDTLDITIDAQANTKTLITTPGAARIYRAREVESQQRQNITISIDKNASVEWFPMETIVYDGADAQLTTTIQLEENSHFVAWEITCLGLPAGNKPFNQGSILQTYRIEKNGLPLFIDRLQFSPEKSQWFYNQAGMGKATCSGFFMAGPFDFSANTKSNKANAVALPETMPEAISETISQEGLTEKLRALIEAQQLEKKLALTWVNDFCMVRYLGDSAFEARDSFIALWEELRPALLERKASSPGIWKT